MAPSRLVCKPCDDQSDGELCMDTNYLEEVINRASYSFLLDDIKHDFYLEGAHIPCEPHHSISGIEYLRDVT